MGYLNILFNVSEEFNWKIYYFNNKDILKDIDNERKKYYNVSSDFNYLKYSDNNAFFYMNTRINVTSDFVYLFYKKKITLDNLYNFYKNNVVHEHIKQINSFTSK